MSSAYLYIIYNVVNKINDIYIRSDTGISVHLAAIIYQVQI